MRPRPRRPRSRSTGPATPEAGSRSQDGEDQRRDRGDAEQEDEPVERLLDEWVVAEALLRIPADQRAVLLRTFHGGEPYRDVADDLRIPEGTARTRAFHGLPALRERLIELGWER